MKHWFLTGKPLRKETGKPLQCTKLPELKERTGPQKPTIFSEPFLVGADPASATFNLKIEKATLVAE